jgi:sec-independent protein translocase protein TatC
MSYKKVKEESAMSFLDHLEVLRWHLIRAVSSAFIFMILAFINRDFIFTDIILKPKNPEFFTNRLFKTMGEWLHAHLGISADVIAINNQPLSIVNIDMAGQFTSHIKISIVAGLVVASPYIIWEIWRFIKPALHSKERKYASGAVFYISTLFILGILFGYYLIAPLSIHFLSSYVVSSEVLNTIKLNSYIGTITSVTFASGIIFELPMVVLFLSKVGLMSPGFMRKYRRHAYVILLIVAAIITPPDVFSQILVCIPLIILYEISVFISRSVERSRKREMEQENKISSGDENNNQAKQPEISGEE